MYINLTILKLLSLFVLVLMLGSCRDEFQKSDSGLLFKVLDKGETDVKPRDDEYLLLDISLKTSGDSILYNSETAGGLFHIKYDTYAQKLMKPNPLREMFFSMNKGDSLLIKIEPENLAFINPHVAKRADEYLFCHVRLVDIFEYEAYSQWQKDQLEKREEARNLYIKEQAALEVQAIDSLLKAEGKKFQISSSGIRYMIAKDGTGRYPEKGDSLYYHYKVTYLDGEVLPGELGTSGKTAQLLVLGATNSLQSWQESLMLLKKGGAGKFYIPPALAFGKSEGFGVRSDAVLVANIELIDLKSAK